MAAPTIVAIMDAIETKLKAPALGLSLNAALTDAMPTPAAFVELPDVPNYRETFAMGKVRYEPQVVVLTEKLISRVGLRALASYADLQGTKSIRVALEADKSLGGVVDDCIVLSFRPLSTAEVGQYGFVGGLFTLRIMASGS